MHDIDGARKWGRGGIRASALQDARVDVVLLEQIPKPLALVRGKYYPPLVRDPGSDLVYQFGDLAANRVRPLRPRRCLEPDAGASDR
jgi:hypothetical protein